MSNKELTEHFVSVVKPFINCDSAQYDSLNMTSSHHLMWMIENMDGEVKSAKFLGFIIGIMIANGMVDIENEHKYLTCFLNND
jgi:hypothetical protein